ncbi:MAG: RdgB/HAM1 family non-canonical purine NTP pyrophosphatase [Planctomycetes bacterium]|nr:RdgB/HAM1 family non-canonical purine NTP pyrophosphatase [Planctomycetota bacterium]
MTNSAALKNLITPPTAPIVVATTNRKKLGEMRLLLEPLGYQLRNLADFEKSIEIEENGTTFIENARLKAVGQARFLGQWCIGEDSGLVVPALDGAPGIYSARYSGPNATDQSNNALLLEKMAQFKDQQRAAYYVSTAVLADPDGNIHIESEGKCWGRILTAPRGVQGFGYDPLFEIAEYHLTFAELGSTVKSVLSHRARAMEIFKRQLVSRFAS